MVRISGVDLPDDKKVNIALTRIYGLGRHNVDSLLRKVKIESDKRMKHLTEEEISKIQRTIDKEFKVEGELRAEVAENIKRLKAIGSYRGLRHIRGLPTRGQRTRSNARTKRGKRKTVGALRKETRIRLERTQTSKAQTAVKKK